MMNKLIIILCLFSLWLEAQITTKLYMHDGSLLIGEMKTWHDSIQSYSFQTTDGINMTIPKTSIKKLKQYDKQGNRTAQYQFKEKGYYNISNFSFMPGNNSFNQFLTGFSLSMTNGYMFNRYLGLGQYLAVDNYDINSYDKLYPMGLEVRSYFFGKQNAYYTCLAGAYSVAFKKNYPELTSAKGGPMLYPAVGVRFGGKKHFNFTADLGLKFQKANWKLDLPEYEIKQDINKVYRRFIIRVGIQI